MAIQRLKFIYDNLVSKTEIYNPEEAGEVVFLLLEKKWGVSRSDLLVGETDKNPEEFNSDIMRINSGEPIQYILGESWFRGRKFLVNPSVLIPRPETEEIIDYIISQHPLSVLDLGTGSGCIAISLALESEKSDIFAIDISDDALKVAQDNADFLNAKVNFAKANILNFKNPFQKEKFETIVSNPPYVRVSEMREMHKNVLDYEPHLALFVDDEDPLLFYKQIGILAEKYLAENGTLWMEINSYLGQETKELFKNLGYHHQRLVKDIFDRDRFIEIKP